MQKTGPVDHSILLIADYSVAGLKVELEIVAEVVAEIFARPER